MIEPLLLAQAVDKAPVPAPSFSSTLTQDAMGISRMPGDIEALPFLQHLAQVMPAADVAFGGAMLMLIVVVHATGVRWVTGHVARRLRLATLRPTIWRADVLMAVSVLLLLALHLFEVVIWATSLVYSGLVPSWRAAGFFAGNTYTTVGYGSFVLPAGWEMLAPIIAISGLFTFGWSGSVLVDIVARCQRIKDAVTDQQAAPPAPPSAH
jgi:hypothetical protein